MNEQEQIESGSRIIKAVYKASIKALFAIGVKSPENVDKFSLHFSQELDKEFLKIGLFEVPGGTKRESYPVIHNETDPPGTMTLENVQIKYDEAGKVERGWMPADEYAQKLKDAGGTVEEAHAKIFKPANPPEIRKSGNHS